MTEPTEMELAMAREHIAALSAKRSEHYEVYKSRVRTRLKHANALLVKVMLELEHHDDPTDAMLFQLDLSRAMGLVSQAMTVADENNKEIALTQPPFGPSKA